MASIKKVLLSKKIAGTLYRVYPKTSADQVLVDDTTTVADQLATLAEELSNTLTNTGVQSMIDESTEALYNKIMGLTDSQTTISEAYDTLKEVADYLTEHEDVVSGFTSDISDLKSAVSSLEGAIAALDYSKVTASSTNGNIVIDGEETTVYTLPETLSAEMIEETDDKQFVTAAEKTIIANAGTATIEATTTEPDDSTADDNTLYIVYEEESE